MYGASSGYSLLDTSAQRCSCSEWLHESINHRQSASSQLTRHAWLIITSTWPTTVAIAVLIIPKPVLYVLRTGSRDEGLSADLVRNLGCPSCCMSQSELFQRIFCTARAEPALSPKLSDAAPAVHGRAPLARVLHKSLRAYFNIVVPDAAQHSDWSLL